MKRIKKWWAGRNRVRFYRCRSTKCGYAFTRQGKQWIGPYWVEHDPGESHVVEFPFGRYYSGIARPLTEEQVRIGWSDCWPLMEIA